MKKLKKLAIAMPLAGILATGALGGTTSSFADTSLQNSTVTNYTSNWEGISFSYADESGPELVLHAKEPLKVDTTFELYSYGRKVCTLGTYKKGEHVNNTQFDAKITGLSPDQFFVPDSSFEFKANGITIDTYKSPYAYLWGM
ncbi:hypothetical protein [Bacillus mycoides]|uniref:hypothetical protein n=1 Tax=Bacillus mycoides TaxID=1405 RepID=UPI0011A9C8BE|nr:hypothetical protein [Bacillus mycoides]